MKNEDIVTNLRIQHELFELNRKMIIEMNKHVDILIDLFIEVSKRVNKLEKKITKLNKEVKNERRK